MHIIRRVVRSSPLLAVTLAGILACGRGAAAGAAPVIAGACPDTERTRAAESRIQAVVDSVLAARPAAHGIALHVEAPRLCLSRTFVAGLADPARGRPLTANTPVRMASNTKTYVAAAILRLVEDGRVGLDAPIATYLPSEYIETLRAGGYDAATITVRHLLSHTSGLFDYAMSSPFLEAVTGNPTRRWTRLEQVKFAVEHGKPYGAPGEVYHYSDTGYILLGEILERVTKQPLAAALRSLIGYDRLGLASTWLETLEPAPRGIPDRAHQYMGEADTYTFDPSFDLYGGGGLAATVRDMAVFTRALMTGRVFRSPEMLRVMTETIVVPGARRYRLGIARSEIAGATAWGHSGFWNTFSLYLPDLDLTLAGSVQQNAEHEAAVALQRLVIDAVRQNPEAKRSGAGE